MDYTTVTETPGDLITQEALRMARTRYGYAASFCEGKDVLEVGCGAGLGLGCLARRARSVVGGDATRRLLEIARSHHGASRPLVQLDAQALPFGPQSFDVVILYEAIYYIPRPDRFLAECRRVLRRDGLLLLSTVNREWPDFNPSPHSRRYYSARELERLLGDNSFRAEIYGAFPARNGSLRSAAVSLIKRTAVALRLVPRTMRGKRLLKRIFLGRLARVPPDIELAAVPDAAPPAAAARSIGAEEWPHPIGGRGRAAPEMRILYAVGRPS